MAGLADRGNLDQQEREKPLSNGKTKNSNCLPTHGPAYLAALAGALTLLLAACAVPIPQDTFGRVNPLSTSEREALVALYNATGGAEWKRNAKWLSNEHIASWSGVRYYHQIRESGGAFGTSSQTVEFVRELHLPGNGLTGEIPPKLHGLNDLRHLDLRGNRLTGEIPSQLGRMDHLSHLFLSGNQLTGEIPSKLGDMDGLYYLNLANNRLTGEIPPELGDLGPRLRRLSLRGNQLTGEIPPELGDIRDLEVLDLRNNNLTGQIPAELDNPRNMSGLYLGGNQFTGCIPDTFNSVRYNDILLLNLPLCGGGALPGDITSRALIALFNSTGGYNWHDDTNWGSSQQTSSWYGVSNRAARNPRHVTMLQLPENNLTGELPPELGNLSSLSILDLRGNNLTGEIPAELNNLRLLMLRLSGNRFTGCIPPGLDSITDNDLWDLDLPFCGDEARLAEETSSALLALHAAAGGDSWHDNTGWLTDQPVSQWVGVGVGASHDPDGPHFVKELQLPENNLTGGIPPELGRLSRLGRLDLRGNNLTGQIPAELGDLLPELKTLHLAGNRFTGCIPDALWSVQDHDFSALDLPFCGVAAVPDRETGRALLALYTATHGKSWVKNTGWFSDQPVSQWYGVGSGNSHYSYGPHIAGTLILPDNGLTGELPPELGGMGSLRVLQLNKNRLIREIPPELGKLKLLEVLNLSGNKLRGEIPWELTNLDRMRALALSGNSLNGPIPAGLGKLQQLSVLVLSWNSLSGEIPPELGNLSMLSRLDLRGNRLTGQIPPELGDLLPELKELHLAGNPLTGCIPDALRLVETNDFSKLDLPFCADAARLAEETNSALLALYNATGGDNWHDNTGWFSDQPVNQWFGVGGGVARRDPDGSPFVKELRLSENNLTGQIPPELSKLSRLIVLDLSGNNLTGEIPPELANLDRMERLNLSENNLTGEIPPELSQLPRISVLDLSGNNLTGEIPPELNKLYHKRPPLRVLRLDGNQFSGCIPAVLRRVESNDLSTLGLPFCATTTTKALLALYDATGGDNWHNNTEWLTNQSLNGWFGLSGGSSHVSSIRLPENNLTGEIPPELGNLKRLVGLTLSGNNLTGEIPPELEGMDWLSHLRLRNNQLTGEIPPGMGNLNRLVDLDLSGNNLTGGIPPELGRLRYLETLDLSGNNLTGEIPSKLGNIYPRALRLLRLSGNNLTGCIPADLRSVPDNDLSELGLPFCEP